MYLAVSYLINKREIFRFFKMISNDISSGELFYRVVKDKGPLDTSSYPQLHAFLNLSDTNDDSLQRIEQLQRKLKTSFASKYCHYSVTSLLRFRSKLEAIILRLYQEKLQLTAALQSNQDKFDYIALQAVLQYASILQQEIQEATDALLYEKATKDSLKEQAKICKELLIFAIQLSKETKEKIELQQLSPNSAQFTRCVKAVHDNLHNIFGFQSDSTMIPTANNVRILNVFKLKNIYLAQNLQKAASRSAGAKMKGLFCCMPIQNIYRFSVFGLQEQLLPSPNPSSLKQREEQLQEQQHILQEYFSIPWFLSNKTPLAPIPLNVATFFKEHGSALQTILQHQQSPLLSKPLLRFSKYSTVSTLLHFNDQQLQSGLSLALCRVLIVRLKTITNKFIEDIDIQQAIQQGYDAIYSSLRYVIIYSISTIYFILNYYSSSEEYALLNPQHVLPEFFIHSDFTSLKQSTLLPTPINSCNNINDPMIKNPKMMMTRLPSYLQQSKLTSKIEMQRNISLFSSLSIDHQLYTAQSLLMHNHIAYIDQQNHYPGSGIHSGSGSISNSSNGVTIDNSTNSSKSTNKDQQSSSSSSSHQNIKRKQAALSSIETSVEEFRTAWRACVLQSAKRVLQQLRQEKTVSATSSTKLFTHQGTAAGSILSNSSSNVKFGLKIAFSAPTLNDGGEEDEK
jgi:hypothetical protein